MLRLNHVHLLRKYIQNQLIQIPQVKNFFFFIDIQSKFYNINTNMNILVLGAVVLLALIWLKT